MIIFGYTTILTFEIHPAEATAGLLLAIRCKLPGQLSISSAGGRALPCRKTRLLEILLDKSGEVLISVWLNMLLLGAYSARMLVLVDFQPVGQDKIIA